MNAVTAAQMRSMEQSLFAKGVDAATLMAQAGWGIACSVRKFFPNPGTLHVYLGKGHNAGDALSAAQHLRRWGWQIELHRVYPEIEWATLTRQQLRELELIPQACSSGRGPTVIMEALLGIGASGPLREPIREAAIAIQAQRSSHAIPVIALDLPTGVDADSGAIDPRQSSPISLFHRSSENWSLAFLRRQSCRTLGIHSVRKSGSRRPRFRLAPDHARFVSPIIAAAGA